MEMCDVTFHKLQAILGFGDIRFFIIGNSLLCFHILWVTMASAMVQSLLHHPTLLPLSLLTYRPILFLLTSTPKDIIKSLRDSKQDQTGLDRSAS